MPCMQACPSSCCQPMPLHPPRARQPAHPTRSHVLGALVQGLPMATPARGMLGASSFMMAPMAGRLWPANDSPVRYSLALASWLYCGAAGGTGSGGGAQGAGVGHTGRQGFLHAGL